MENSHVLCAIINCLAVLCFAFSYFSIGKPALIKLGILRFNSDVVPEAFSFKNNRNKLDDFQKYHTLFCEGDTFKIEMNIYIKEVVYTFVQFVPRIMYISLLKAFKRSVKTVR